MKIRTRKYVEDRLRDLRRYYDAELEAMRRAVDKYSVTNDEWKEIHNGLQRQMEHERAIFLKKDELGRMVQLLVAVGMFLIALAVYFKK